MGMDAVLKQLEAKIEEMVQAYKVAGEREAALTAQVADLESQLAAATDAAARVAELDQQRDRLAGRLQAVLASIDEALEAETSSSG